MVNKIINFEIHDLTKNDHKYWLELYLKYAEYYEVEIPEDNFNLTWEWINDDEKSLQGIIAKSDNKFIGFAHFRSMPSPLESCEIGFLDDLYVLPEFRGYKIGFSLIERVRQIGENKGWPYINWITKDNNYNARMLYDKIATKTDWNFYELVVKK